MRFNLLISIILFFVTGYLHAQHEMGGQFSGVGALVHIDNNTVRSWIPASLTSFVDLDSCNEVHPVIVMAGEQRNVAVAKSVGGIRWRPNFLQKYPEVMIIIPNLKIKGEEVTELYWTFAQIYVEDERIVNASKNLNDSPKVLANIERDSDSFSVKLGEQVIIKLAANPSASHMDIELSAANRTKLESYFSQRKLEVQDYTLIKYEFNWLKRTERLEPRDVGTSLLLTKDLLHSFEPLRFDHDSSHFGFYIESRWNKRPAN